MINEKGFNTMLTAIKKNAEGLAMAIHNAGLFALSQVNEHGNDGFAVRLIDAMGKKHDAQRVVNWLCHYGKLQVKKGVICYRARKDIDAANLDAMLTQAEANPYWVHTPQKELVFSVDVLTKLKGILSSLEKAHKLEGEGKNVSIQNEGMATAIKELIAKHTPVQPKLETGLVTQL